ncbi:CPBP family intramembrane glutamic endopeptidase [Parvularcula sp. IMCC14364]|uniref:CPBP family intramembrane glutamic endopeptidase n=1 Tax=Parvularcula sp. IMCC14364 TaxID=3067902 RepID=UPI0027429835|nr:CPBP family intramembrane glutamic endopeptidase [Parvularcula sp. IMCC14364]
MIKPPFLRQGLSGKRQTQGWLAMLVSIGILFCAALAGLTLFSPVLLRQESGSSAQTLSQFSLMDAGITIIGFAVLILLLTCGWVKFFEKRQISSLGLGPQFHRRFARGMLAGLVAATLLATSLVVFFDAEMSLALGQVPVGAFVLTFALLPLAWFVQAMSEEVLFRGFLLQSLGLRYGFVAAIFFSSLLFAGLHFEDGGSGAGYFIGMGVFAAFLCCYAVFDNSLWGPVGFNMAWNLALNILFGVSLNDSGRDDIAIYNALARSPKLLVTQTETGAFAASFIGVSIVLIIVLVVFTVSDRFR